MCIHTRIHTTPASCPRASEPDGHARCTPTTASPRIVGPPHVPAVAPLALRVLVAYRAQAHGARRGTEKRKESCSGSDGCVGGGRDVETVFGIVLMAWRRPCVCVCERERARARRGVCVLLMTSARSIFLSLCLSIHPFTHLSIPPMAHD